MAETGPSDAQILVEWMVADPATDLARWREGIRLYEAGSLDDGARMGAAAELMCAALTHYVADGSIVISAPDEAPETTLAQTIWNVLIAALHGGGGSRPAGLDRCLRLGLAAARQGAYQPEDLGGNGLMAEAFGDDGRAVMVAALAGSPAGGQAPVRLAWWFAGQPGLAPGGAPPGALAGAASPVSPAAAQEKPESPESRWGTLRKRAQQAKQHVNPLALQHGIEAVQGALTEAKIAKIDKKGQLKIKKFGVAKAALRPTTTFRRAVDGAAVTEHLKSYQESFQARGRPGDQARLVAPVATQKEGFHQMNFKELTELVPWLVAKKMEDASPPVPLADGTAHEEAPSWTFRTDPALVVAVIFPKTNELRLTVGLATDLAYTADLGGYLNFLNTKQLVFGRAYVVPVPSTTGDRVALLMQEIVFGDGLSWDYPPSIQNLLRIMGTLCGQGARLARETLGHFEGRPLADAEAGVLLALS